LLAHRVVAHAPRVDSRVVALGTANGTNGTDKRLDLRRVRRLPVGQRASVAWLNACGLFEALRFRPDLILAIHISVSPAAWVASRLLRAPVTQYLHADEARARPRLTRFAGRRAAAIVTVSGHTRDMALMSGIPAERIHLIPPGVDLPQDRRAERASEPTIVTVARLEDRYKGHDVLMRAMPRILSQVPEARWVIVGDGSLRPELRRLAAEQGVAAQVRFTGTVSDEERDRWLDRAHVFAMPSRLPPEGTGGEGFGIVYMEAAAHGLPVVAGKVAGALDAVQDGQTGLLVDPIDAEQLADAIAGLLIDRERADRLGSAGAKRARQYAWPVIAGRLEELLLDLGGER
jgi:phosphatidyl-myo-inositol dimannoside synthase